MPSSVFDKLARLIVRYSTAIGAGDRVHLCCSPAAAKLLAALCQEVRQAGGLPLIDSEVESPDACVYVATPDAPLAPTSKPARWAATACPRHPPAEVAGLTPQEYASIFVQGCCLDQPNPTAAWLAASQRQARLLALLHDVRQLRFVTLAGTDLRLDVAGRTWINGDGHHNMPDGEVYTGPIEDATEGLVCFDTATIRLARLSFRAGRVVDASAHIGETALIDMLAQDDGARTLGEVGIGCNERLARMIGHPLFDEKIAGTFHVALGASFPATGGQNQSAVHWDLVCDLRPGGRIEADGQTINDNGHWIVN